MRCADDTGEGPVRTTLGAVVAAAGIIVLVMTSGMARPLAAAPFRAERSPVGSVSPSAATPRATQLPLYTPIPVSEARNVVGRATIHLTDRGFIPSRFEQAINQPITFTLVNTGTRRHNFRIAELDVDVDVDPGQTTTFTILSPRRLGHYTYASDTPEDRALGMTGTMTIFI